MIRRTMWLSLEMRQVCLMSREALLGIRTGIGAGGFVVIIYNLGLCVIFLF